MRPRRPLRLPGILPEPARIEPDDGRAHKDDVVLADIEAQLGPDAVAAGPEEDGPPASAAPPSGAVDKPEVPRWAVALLVASLVLLLLGIAGTGMAQAERPGQQYLVSTLVITALGLALLWRLRRR